MKQLPSNSIGFLLIILAVFFIGQQQLTAQDSKKETVNYTKKDVAKVVDYIHRTYRDDYTSLPSKQTLDWQKACVAMMFVHAYEVLGNKKYLDWAEEAAYVAFDFSDDQCWGANAILELNRHNVQVSSKPYTDYNDGQIYNEVYSYQTIFDKVLTTPSGTAPSPYFGFLDSSTSGFGGIFWNKEKVAYHSCTMGQAIVLAYLIPEISINGKSPKDFASGWMDIQQKYLIDQDSGRVFDSYRLTSKKKNLADFTYNYGTTLAALGLAWNKDKARQPHSGAIADAIVNYIITQMTNEYGVLYNPNAVDLSKDSIAFNGVFMHFVPYYLFSEIPSANKNKLKEYINNCALAVWKQNDKNPNKKNDNYGISYSWGRPYDENTANCMTTVSGVECLLTNIQIKENKNPYLY